MSAVQVFLAVLLLLHLSEFCIWVPRGCLLFRRRGRGWEAATRGALLETVRGSLHWVMPFPGLARAHAVRVMDPLEPASLPVAPASRHGRGPETVIAFDPGLIERRRIEVARVFAPLRWTSTGLLVVLWVAVPASLFFLGIGPTLGWAAPVLATLMVFNARILFLRHRDLFAGAGDDRLRLVLSACLSPLAAMRSWDLAQKEALSDAHPVAVAAALPGFRGWESMAADEWRRLRYPGGPGPAVDSARQIPPEVHDVLGHLERLARTRGIDPTTWETPPMAEDPTHAQYCPRCRGQFTAQATACRDCGGRPLLPLPAR